ncbi:Hypothetical predicted protein [Marmota monax]|uniref:Uncharacterized protein n=1 Tax=Marmota monax TaxID=9995 RepID=A0A5E4CX69_MARMO|nr:hypothetical protein GHT09_016956 [Marmota monax]VTJ86413.1 Hypothetical predicted protein [Marmota monax]
MATPMERITAIATEASAIRATSQGLKFLIMLPTVPGEAVLTVVTLEVVTTVLVPLELDDDEEDVFILGRVDPEEMVVFDPEEVVVGDPEEGAVDDPEEGAVGDPEEGAVFCPEEVAVGDPEEGDVGDPEEVVEVVPEEVAVDDPGRVLAVLSVAIVVLPLVATAD